MANAFDVYTANIGPLRRRRLEGKLRKLAELYAANLTRMRVHTIFTPNPVHLALRERDRNASES